MSPVYINYTNLGVAFVPPVSTNAQLETRAHLTSIPVFSTTLFRRPDAFVLIFTSCHLFLPQSEYSSDMTSYDPATIARVLKLYRVWPRFLSTPITTLTLMLCPQYTAGWSPFTALRIEGCLWEFHSCDDHCCGTYLINWLKNMVLRVANVYRCMITSWHSERRFAISNWCPVILN